MGAARFARRTDWDLGTSPIEVAADRRRAAGGDVLDLTDANPTRAGLDLPVGAIGAALARGARAPYAPEPLGGSAARAALAAWLGPPVDARRLLLTASTSEAYAHLFRLLLDPGDGVLVPRPSYPLLDLLAELCDARIGSFPLDAEHAFRVDEGPLEASVEPHHRVLVAVSPNNPTGSVLGPGELRALARVAARHGLVLVLDEVFRDHVRAGAEQPAAWSEVHGLLADVPWFSLGGLSKTLSAPGLKLAWTVVGGPEPFVSAALARLEVIADTFLSPSWPVQAALPELLALVPGAVAATRARLDANVRALGMLVGSAVTAAVGAGGWSAMLRVPRLRSDLAWAVALAERDGVLVHPGSFYGMDGDGWLVVSLLPAPADFAEALRRLLVRVAAG